MKSFIIFGCGRFGSSVAKILFSLGHEVLVVDDDYEKINAISNDVTTAVQMDILDEDVEEALGVHNFDVAVVAIGENLEAATLATLIAVESELSYILAKAQNHRQGTILKKIGANEVVYPEKDMGERIAYHLSSEGLMEYLTLSEEFGIMELKIRKDWIGKDLKAIDFRNKFKVNIIAIRRDDDILIDELESIILKKEDRLIFIGNKNQVYRIEASIAKDNK